MDERSRWGIEPAPQWIVRFRQIKVENALVLRNIGVALLQYVIAPREVAIELTARPRGASDDELTVPLGRQPEENPRLASRVVGDAPIQLNTRYGFGDRCMSRGRDHRAVCLRRKGERREAWQGIIGGRRLG